MITIGLFLASLVNYGTKDRDDSGSYRIPLAVQFIYSLILMGGMYYLPETPRLLVKRNRRDDAIKSLMILRRLPADHEALQREFNEIVMSYEYELSLGKSSYKDCFRGTVAKRTITGVLLQALQQLTGVNFIFY